ncbi:MAG: hypothetical protein M3P26_16340 [Gemmatimonadota bacterium]|nr:hypothetical protein [Gemmatimonadota bacterium]
MSYCRWSSDNWRCDLYCYQDISLGYTTHVAGNRVVGDIPQEPDWALLVIDLPRFGREHAAVMAFLDTAERRPIGLPHDGATFHDPDLASFLSRVTELRKIGYNVPDYVFDEIREEMAAA